MTVFRKGGQRDLKVTVVELQPDQPASARTREAPKPAAPTNALGLVVSDLSAEKQKELGVKGGVQVDARRRPGGGCRVATGRRDQPAEQRRGAERQAVQRGRRQAGSEEGRRGARPAGRGVPVRRDPALEDHPLARPLRAGGWWPASRTERGRGPGRSGPLLTCHWRSGGTRRARGACALAAGARGVARPLAPTSIDFRT